MVSLKVGKREGNNIYLIDNSRMSRQEWSKKVHEQVKQNGDQAIYNGLYEIASVIHRLKEDAELTALFYYVSEMHKDKAWAQSVGYRQIEQTFSEKLGEMGEKQLAFF